MAVKHTIHYSPSMNNEDYIRFFIADTLIYDYDDYMID